MPNKVLHGTPCTQEPVIKMMQTELETLNNALLGREGIIAIQAAQMEITKEQGRSIDKLHGLVQSVVTSNIQTEKEKEVILRVIKERRLAKRYLATSLIAGAMLFLTVIGLAIKINTIIKDKEEVIVNVE